MINRTEAMLIAKCIRNTHMASTTKQAFVRELIKIFKNDSPWFKDKLFRNLALLGTEPDGMTKYHMNNLEKKLNEI